MKRFRDMEQLSGGEKTIAALALLFAIHRCETSSVPYAHDSIANLNQPQFPPIAFLRSGRGRCCAGQHQRREDRELHSVTRVGHLPIHCDQFEGVTVRTQQLPCWDLP